MSHHMCFKLPPNIRVQDGNCLCLKHIYANTVTQYTQIKYYSRCGPSSSEQNATFSINIEIA